MSKWLTFCVSVFLFAGRVQAQGAIDLTTLDKDMAGPRAQVAVLGTMHLSEMKDFKAASLDALLDKLAAFKPQIITIEAISGEQCDLVARYASIYGQDYCEDRRIEKAALGLDVPMAIAQVSETLKNWPAAPTSAQRRHLAALFLAAGERASAYVQWLQLPESERRAGDGLDTPLVTLMRKIDTQDVEDDRIAARLAARLGLARVYPIDDHTGDNLDISDARAFGEAVQAAWDTEKNALNASLEQQKKLAQEPDLLPLYRYLNRPDNLAMLARLNVVTAMRSKSAQGYPQMWVAGWETRNLRMIANVRATFRERPGARVLSIVGVSHKPWFDGWLGQLQGVEIVDVEKVLK
ncbi:MAG TPA: DUF5694 domain-containing protein [Rudaea sp.]